MLEQNRAEASSFSNASASSAYRWASSGLPLHSNAHPVSMQGKEARGSTSRARSSNRNPSSGF